MKKFIVLYMASAEGMEHMKNMSEQDQQKDMQGWMDWMNKYKEHFVEEGAPAGKNTRLTKEGAAEVTNEVMGYSIMQAGSKDELAGILKENGHLELPGAYIEIMDWIEMPGM